MAYKFHSDPRKKWDQQYLTSRNHIIPFILQQHKLPENANVLEVGCGEGGVLKAFCETGFTCYGVDIAKNRIENANQLLAEEVNKGKVTFYAADVHDTRTFSHLEGKIDVLILKDAIEHIYDQEKILHVLHKFIKPDGLLFVAFPPWYNPFGGHQQLAASFLKYLPWFHLLPKALYRKVLKGAGETETQIQVLMEIYDTRLVTAKFEKLLRTTNWKTRKRQFYLFNPIYEYKFGIKGRQQLALLNAIPVLRDILSTAVYYLLNEPEK